MKIFVTGATGFVGSAVVRELMDAGHRVLGLARNDAAAEKLKQQGIEAHRGDVTDLASLAAGARAADGVIHTAFNHDFSKWAEHCEDDRRAIEALGDTLAGSRRPLVVTSGTGLVATPGRLAAETDPPTSPVPRIASEQAADAVRSCGVNVSVVRLPPSVHGDGDHGFVPMLIGIAREKQASAYVNEGGNRWPAVHRLDAARLYRLVLEKGAAGARYHGVGDEGVAFRDIAALIGRRLDLPVISQTTEQAAAHFGWFSHFAALDAPASSAWTQKTLGWRPSQPGLIEDLERGTYF